MKRLLQVCTAVALSVSSILAHEFVLKPVHTDAKVGSKLPLSAMVAHRFMVSEEIENIDYVDIKLVEAGKKGESISLKPNDAYLTLDGVVEPTKKGGAIISGHRKAMAWSKTTQGWKVGDKKTLKGVLESNLYEKFCKVQLTVDGDDSGFDTVLGDRLEIVPLSSPLNARPGDELSFQILFDGKPLAATVQAGYDGFSRHNNGYAFSGDTDESGIITIPMHSKGLWLVRVNHDAEPKDKKTYGKHNIRAIYIFEIR